MFPRLSRRTAPAFSQGVWRPSSVFHPRVAFRARPYAPMPLHEADRTPKVGSLCGHRHGSAHVCCAATAAAFAFRTTRLSCSRSKNDFFTYRDTLRFDRLYRRAGSAASLRRAIESSHCPRPQDTQAATARAERIFASVLPFRAEHADYRVPVTRCPLAWRGHASPIAREYALFGASSGCATASPET